MGATSSKPAPEFTEKRRQQETVVVQAKELADTLATLDLNGVAVSENGSLDGSLLGDWEHAAAKVSHLLSSQSTNQRTKVICFDLRTLFYLCRGRSFHIPTLVPPYSEGHP